MCGSSDAISKYGKWSLQNMAQIISARKNMLDLNNNTEYECMC